MTHLSRIIDLKNYDFFVPSEEAGSPPGGSEGVVVHLLNQRPPPPIRFLLPPVTRGPWTLKKGSWHQ